MNITDTNVYEYLINFADDRTILNMLSVNRKFNDDNFFERLLRRKYPLLIKYKKEKETFKQLFIRMVYYISLLEDKYGIPYIPGSDPQYIYKNNNIIKYLYQTALMEAIKYGHLDIVKILVEKSGFNIRQFDGPFGLITFNDFNIILEQAAKYGRLDIINYAIEKGANDLDLAMYEAASNGQLESVHLLYTKGAENIDRCIDVAAEKGHIEIVKFLVERGENFDLEEALAEAAFAGHLNIVKYLIEKGHRNLNRPLLSAIDGQHLEIVKFLIDSGANNIQEAITFAQDEEVDTNIIYYLRTLL